MKTPRPTLDETGLMSAVIWSRRSTCARRRVGCVLTDERGHVLATGYNGRPARWKHCTEDPCPGANKKSGTHLDLCEAIHAEANALLQCPDVQKIWTAYCTTAPCVECVKLLLNTGCRRIVFMEDYSHSGVSRERWQRYDSSREWIHMLYVSLG